MEYDEGKASCGAGEVEDCSRASRDVGQEAPPPALRADDDLPARPAGALSRIRRALGFVGVTMALPFFVWLPLGLLGIVPSILAFGVYFKLSSLAARRISR